MAVTGSIAPPRGAALPSPADPAGLAIAAARDARSPAAGRAPAFDTIPEPIAPRFAPAAGPVTAGSGPNLRAAALVILGLVGLSARR